MFNIKLVFAIGSQEDAIIHHDSVLCQAVIRSDSSVNLFADLVDSAPKLLVASLNGAAKINPHSEWLEIGCSIVSIENNIFGRCKKSINIKENNAMFVAKSVTNFCEEVYAKATGGDL